MGMSTIRLFCAASSISFQRSFSYLVSSEQQLMQGLRRRNEDLMQTLDTLRQTRSELSIAQRLVTVTPELLALARAGVIDRGRTNFVIGCGIGPIPAGFGIQVAMTPAIPSAATIRGMPASGTLLMVDANQQWDRVTAQRFGRAERRPQGEEQAHRPGLLTSPRDACG